MNKEFICFYPLNPLPAPRPRLGRGGAYNPKKYSDYLKELIEITQLEMKRQNFKPFKNVGLSVEVLFNRENKVNCDIDNLQKSIFDAIVKAGLIEDDKHIWEANTRKDVNKKAVGTYLKVRELF